MRHLLLSSLLAVSLLSSSHHGAAQGLAKQWDKTFSMGYDKLAQIQATSDGGSVAAGYTSTSSGSDYWIVKLNAAGTKQWDRTIGGPGPDMATCIQPTQDGGYIVGGNTSGIGTGRDKSQANHGSTDYWVVKLDANGTKQWDRTFGGTAYNLMTQVQQTSDGGYLLVGYSNSGISGNKTQPNLGLPSTIDIWLVKLDASGAKQWDKTIGGTGNDYPYSLLLTTDGNYLIGGSSESDVGYDKTQPRQGSADGWLVKVAANGTKLWDKTYGSPNPGNDPLPIGQSPRAEHYIKAVLPTLDGGYLLSANSNAASGGDKSQNGQGYEDFWILKVDATGNKIWDKTYGGSLSDNVTEAQPTSDGGYLIAGSSNSPINGDKTQANYGIQTSTDYWLVKLDANGLKQWDQVIKGNYVDELAGLALTLDGGYVLGGMSVSDMGGDKSQPCQGEFDYWIVKLSPLAATATSATSPRSLLSAYPNPAHGRLMVQLPEEAPRTELQVSLLDATGRTVYAQPLRAAPGSTNPVEIGQHPAGLYLLRLEGPKGYLATLQLILR